MIPELLCVPNLLPVQDLLSVPDLISFIPFYVDRNANISRTFPLKNVDVINNVKNIDADVSVDSVKPDESTANVKQNIFTDLQLTMSVKEIHSYIKENGLTNEENKKFMEERRKAKNRGYSRVSRLKKKHIQNIIKT
jgi:hypothetical protein